MKQQLTPILLPTDKSLIYNLHGKLSYSLHGGVSIGDGDKEPQHLYLVSDEEINESEIDTNHCIFKSSNGIITCLAGINLGRVKTIGSYYKIIATTDSELKLPKIPQDFIQYFVEKQGNVGKVMIEYEECETCLDQNQVRTKNPASKNDIITAPCSKCGCVNSWVNDHEDHYCSNIKLKLTKDNEVIISLEEKSYTRDEIIAKLYDSPFDIDLHYGEGALDKWIKQNI